MRQKLGRTECNIVELDRILALIGIVSSTSLLFFYFIRENIQEHVYFNKYCTTKSTDNSFSKLWSPLQYYTVLK